MPAAEPDVSLPGFAFGVADELGKRIHRHRGVHDNDIRVGRQRGYGNEILYRIVVEIFVQCRRDRVLVGAAGQQRVTIGRSSRNIAPANSAASAGDVFDDDGLAEIGRQIMRRDTHRGVGRSAWRVWHDDFDRDGRESLARAPADSTVAATTQNTIATSLRITSPSLAFPPRSRRGSPHRRFRPAERVWQVCYRSASV